jgi:DNA polymerase III epsilon subunit-like protein
MYLFFDTETNGLPANYKAPVSDLENWPRVVQLAWVIADETGAETKSADFIISPDGFDIPADLSAIHGITNEIAREIGVSLVDAAGAFLYDLDSVNWLVAHNIGFDFKVLSAELIRYNLLEGMPARPQIDTMLASTDYCNLPGKFPGRPKWPSLTELHIKLFGEEFAGAHNALTDVRICAKCFFELKKKGVIK